MEAQEGERYRKAYRKAQVEEKLDAGASHLQNLKLQIIVEPRIRCEKHLLETSTCILHNKLRKEAVSVAWSLQVQGSQPRESFPANAQILI